MSKIWPQAINAFCVFFVTLSIFPGVSTSTSPHYANAAEWYASWFLTMLLSTFMVFDFIGRALPRFVRFPAKFLWVSVLDNVLYIYNIVDSGDDAFRIHSIVRVTGSGW